MQKVFICVPVEDPGFRTDGDSSVAISATNVESGFPASNLLTYSSSEVFSTTSGTSVITLDLGRPRDFDVVSVVNCNASYRTTIKIEVSADNSSWTTVKNTSPLWPNYTSVPAAYSGSEGSDPRKNNLETVNSWFRSASVLTYRYVKVTITDPIKSSFTAGRLFIGKSWTPSTGIQYGSTLEFADIGIRERTDGGELILEPIRVIVGANLKMEFATKTEMNTALYSLSYWRGNTKEVLVCLDEAETDFLQRNILYCTMLENRRITSDSFNAYSTNFGLESI